MKVDRLWVFPRGVPIDLSLYVVVRLPVSNPRV